jgi:protein-disulfide isomerase
MARVARQNAGFSLWAMTAPARATAMLAFLTGLAACSSSGSPAPDEPDAAAVGHAEGDRAAPVHVVYFDDYVCDDCARFNKDAIASLRRDWVAKKRARLTLVDVAWKRGSVAGAAAAWCAEEQGKFWEMHDLLFERQEVWKRAVDIPAKLAEYATELGLDSAKYARCAADGKHQRRVDAAEATTRRFGVRGTPAFVVNGRLFYGSQEWPWVEQVLLAYESGKPDAAPPPPFRIPTKKIVDSVRLKELEDSVKRAVGKGVR